MTNSKTTKKALFSSVVALLLCFTMLLGTTFAWFTDSVTSANNVIKSGNLDVNLYYWDNSMATGTSVSIEDEPNLKLLRNVDGEEILWEPGATGFGQFEVANEGSLALKYQLTLNFYDATATAEGKTLADVLSVYAVARNFNTGDDDVMGDANLELLKSTYIDSYVPGYESQSLKDFVLEGYLLPGESFKYELGAFWEPSDKDNEYNVKDGLSINFGVTLLATQMPYEKDAYDDQYDKDATYPDVGTVVTPTNIADIDFTAENTKYIFRGTFDAVTISELGDGSVIDFDNATIGDLTLEDDATVTGTGTLNKINTQRNSAEEITLNITNAALDVAGELGVYNTDGESILNIENSEVYFGTIFVGQHTNNHRSALAEFNVINSFLSGEENGMGSTINIWGRSGVASKIYDSEIYTYSRGWHQSEDANDNALTFQGATSIDVDIQRSNMHLYGARSIINARQYGSENTTINFNIDESLIWVVTKSSHGEMTLPVWGATEITDSMLLFTKNVHQSTPAVFTSFIYGNPVIHGDYHVTTQCQWDADIVLADGQTVTFASDANVSIYEGAGKVQFVPSGSAKVVLEDGATVKNIGGLN